MFACGFDAVRHDELRCRPEYPTEAQTEIHRHTDDQRDISLPSALTAPVRRPTGDRRAPRRAPSVHQHRNVPFLDKTQQCRLRMAPPDVGTCHDDRTLGRRKQARRPVQGVAGWGGTGR